MHSSSQRLCLLLAVIGWGMVGATGLCAGASDAPDLDGDGIPNIVDPDVDNDGTPNEFDMNVDGGIALTGPYAGQYIGDHLNNDNPAELDIDGDGLNDDSLGELDIDGDSNPDNADFETDIDGDGRSDDALSELDVDGDGLNDDAPDEDDIDGDGLEDDDDEFEHDIDGDGIPDDEDDDIDGDGLLNSSEWEDDIDGDGRKNDDPDEDNVDGDSWKNLEDDDDDNDGIRDDRDPDHHPEEAEKKIKVELRRVAAPAESEAKIEIQHYGFGAVEMALGVEGLGGGSIDVLVDGVVRDTLVLIGGSLEVEYDGEPEDENQRLLNFDVLGLPIELRQGGTVMFDGTIPSGSSGAD